MSLVCAFVFGPFVFPFFFGMFHPKRRNHFHNGTLFLLGADKNKMPHFKEANGEKNPDKLKCSLFIYGKHFVCFY